MKTPPASSSLLNPAEVLMLRIQSLRKRIERVVTDLESVTSVSSNGEVGALPGLQAGLRVQVAQLEYFANLSPTTIPEEWLLFIDAIELQVTWLADRAREIRPLSPSLARILNELAWEFSSLMAPTVAARLWLNEVKTSETRSFQAPVLPAAESFQQTAA